MADNLRHITVAVLGCGRVGREVVSRIVERRATHAARSGLRLEVVLLADRSGVMTDPVGMADLFLTEVIQAKAAGAPLGEAAGRASFQPANLERGWSSAAAFMLMAGMDIAVDTTEADTTALLLAIRSQGAGLVLANKVPLSASLASWDAITGQPGPPTAWGTTVASSLPVAAIVRALADAGDPPTRMIGCLSGTMGVLLAGIADGSRPSLVLAQAISAGVAEPDPRRDLDGRDLAAKTLILARTAGLRLEAGEVARTPIVEGLDEGAASLADVSRRLDQAGDDLRRLIAASGGRLRYLAEVTATQASVRLGIPPEDVAAAAPTNSALHIETAGFRAHPLFVSGRGGGAEATAEGVISDLLLVSSLAASSR